MKAYMYIDNAVTSAGIMDTEVFRNLEECMNEADYLWSHLTYSEQKKRDEFVIWELDNVPEDADLNDPTGETFYAFDYCTRLIKDYKKGE